MLEGQAQRAVGLGVPREEHDPGRVAVDAVDDPQAPADLSLEAVLEAGRGVLAPGGNHRETGRLVDRHDVAVLAQDDETGSLAQRSSRAEPTTSAPRSVSSGSRGPIAKRTIARPARATRP